MELVITEGLKQIIPISGYVAVYETMQTEVVCLALDRCGEVVPIIRHEGVFRNAYSIKGFLRVKFIRKDW